MAFKFVDASATGSFQSVFNRLKDDIGDSPIDLTDVPGTGSTQSIKFDGINNKIIFESLISLDDVNSSATNIAFDTFIKNSITAANTRYTFFDQSIIRQDSVTAVDFDGIYGGHIIVTGGSNASYVEFRVGINAYDYVLTSDASITTTAFHNIYCLYNSGQTEMSIYIDGVLDTASALSLVATASPLGTRGTSFGGILDEVRLWTTSAAASSINQIASVSAIGKLPEELGSVGLNELLPSGQTLAGWWRFEDISLVQLLSNLAGSIIDSSGYKHHGTPSSFTGADNPSGETTIINGTSASGDLLSLVGGSLDHGGLLVLDKNNDTIGIEWGSESLIKADYNSWTATGAGVTITDVTDNIYFGNSAVKISTPSGDEGIYMDISNSALLYTGNDYNLKLRYRSVSGTVSARVNFTLGNVRKSVTALTNQDTWQPIIVNHKFTTGSATGRIEVQNLGSSLNTFLLDGLEISEGDYFSSFIGDDRTRKSGQLYWPVTE